MTVNVAGLSRWRPAPQVPSQMLPSLHKPRAGVAAGSQGTGGGRGINGAEGEDGLTVLQGKAASFAEVRFQKQMLAGLARPI